MKDSVSAVPDISCESEVWITGSKIYPNPVASYFNLEVELREAGSLSVKVYSLANNQMMSQLADTGKTRYRKQIEVSGGYTRNVCGSDRN